jgi:type IV fimbrial biogenesis protein FimT
MKKGFTLIETLVTLIVVALLLGWGVPSLLQVMHSARLKSAAHQTYGLLRLARSEAIKQGEPRFVHWYQDKQRWCVTISADQACNCLQESCQLNQQRRTLYSDDFPGISLSEVVFARGSFTKFDGLRGLAEGYAGRVSFTSNDATANSPQLRVTLSRLGRLRFCQLGGIAGYKPC